MRMIFAVTLLLAAAPVSAELPPPGTFDGIVRTVYVSPEEEPLVADLYDRFLTLLAGGKIERGARLPVLKTFSTETETHVIFHRSYYIAPNELRGFEIAVPKESLRKKGANYTVITALRVDQVSQKQSIKIITMKGPPDHRLEGTGASRSAGQTNRTSAAVSPRR